MEQRTVAREWLLLVGLLLVGLVYPIPLGYALGGPNPFALHLALLGDEWMSAWLFVLLPYLLVQLGRSVRWAVTAVRNP